MRYAPVVFRRKELKSVVFVREEFLHEKIYKVEYNLGDLTTNLP